MRAREERRCIVGTNDALRRALKRRSQIGEMVSPYRNLYSPTEHWRGLTPCERSLHVARALAGSHPTWVFTGVTAADVYGFDHSWRLHDAHELWVITPASRAWTTSPAPPAISSDRRWSLRHIPLLQASALATSQIPVAGVERTLIDCGLHLSFQEALPLFDSAARQKVDLNQVLATCEGLRTDASPIRTLTRYADPRSENGGESAVRASIIDYGFAIPELQVEFRSPTDPSVTYRVDFLWRLHDGRVIVMEYDGMAKYEDPSMTRGKTARTLLSERDERDRALRAAGVTTILHCTYEDALMTNVMFRRLRDAGVPIVR